MLDDHMLYCKIDHVIKYKPHPFTTSNSSWLRCYPFNNHISQIAKLVTKLEFSKVYNELSLKHKIKLSISSVGQVTL